MIYKTLHRKIKIEQHESHWKFTSALRWFKTWNLMSWILITKRSLEIAKILTAKLSWSFKAILHQFWVKKSFPWKFNLEYGDTFSKLFMHVSSRIMFPTTRNLQIRVHVYRPRHYCGDCLTFVCFVPMIADHNLVKKCFAPMIADHDLVKKI
jgi:hypothetical protein